MLIYFRRWRRVVMMSWWYCSDRWWCISVIKWRTSWTAAYASRCWRNAHVNWKETRKRNAKAYPNVYECFVFTVSNMERSTSPILHPKPPPNQLTLFRLCLCFYIEYNITAMVHKWEKYNTIDKNLYMKDCKTRRRRCWWWIWAPRREYILLMTYNVAW